MSESFGSPAQASALFVVVGVVGQHFRYTVLVATRSLNLQLGAYSLQQL